MRALERFDAAADAGVGVAMEPGDLLVLANDTALHGAGGQANADRLQAR